MRLSVLAELLPDGGQVVGEDADVSDVTHDSRAVEAGDLFVAVRGAEADGHRFVDAALEAGASAVAVDHVLPGPPSQLLVDDTRAALGTLASAVHGNPSQHLAVVGITGTNGKTTVAHLIESIVAASGQVPGVIGTVGARIEGEHVPVPRTTPEGSDLQRLLARMVDAAVDVAAVEVSSHALSLHRVKGTRFRVVAFTNLMQDHLDFHGDMDAYLESKRRLFDRGIADRAVIAVDDDAGRSIAASTELPATTVAVAGDADVSATDISVTMQGSTFTVQTSDGAYRASVPLPGVFNVQNALVAAAIAAELGIGEDAIISGLAGVGPIPGRFEAVEAGQPFDVVVDYAHTPDAVAAVVGSARELTTGRLIVVVGAGGDRDRDKRPAMGAAAAAADLVVITSDNPRSEDPGTIIEEVASGADAEVELITEPDRRAAIGLALGRAAENDLVLILGKGHEQGQEIGGTVLPFDDRVVAAEVLVEA